MRHPYAYAYCRDAESARRVGFGLRLGESVGGVLVVSDLGEDEDAVWTATCPGLPEADSKEHAFASAGQKRGAWWTDAVRWTLPRRDGQNMRRGTALLAPAFIMHVERARRSAEARCAPFPPGLVSSLLCAVGAGSDTSDGTGGARCTCARVRAWQGGLSLGLPCAVKSPKTSE